MAFVEYLDNTVLRFALKPEDMTSVFVEKNNVDISPKNITQPVK